MSHGQHGQRWKFTSFSIQNVARPSGTPLQLAANSRKFHRCQGAFTVTSFDVSRGRLESLVGKRFVVVWLRVYFAGIQSLFAFISLIHKIMILFCIGAGYIAHCVGGSF